MGASEILVIVLLVFFIATAALPIYLGKKYPNRLWIGIVLCLLNCGMGQFYLPGGLKYFLILAIAFVFLKAAWGPDSAWLIAGFLSVGIMWWRFARLPAYERPD